MFVKVRVTANAKREVFTQKTDISFAVSVKEPAKMNRANIRVRELIASHFSVSKGAVRIVNGHHSPSKILSIKDCD